MFHLCIVVWNVKQMKGFDHRCAQVFLIASDTCNSCLYTPVWWPCNYLGCWI